jgi:hypothetical protein
MAVKGFVYYCPELRLYRYKVEGASESESADYKFDADELEDTLVALLVDDKDQTKAAQAKFLANMTGLARVNPHKIVQFDTGSDKIDVLEPAAFWKKHDEERGDAGAPGEEG